MRAVAWFALVVLLAGCTRETPASVAPTVEPANASPSFALPDDRGVSAAANETNRTEAGLDGVEHKHDYWKGKDTVVLFQGNVGISTIPIFPEGEGSTPKGVGYLKLGKLPDGSNEDALVYEGAEKVTVVAKAPSVRGQADPSSTTLTIQHRTAATAQWSAAQALPYDQAFEIPVDSRETDMPHSTQSLWNFRFVSDKPPTFSSVNVTVTVYRGSDVVDWPGHPDFYADRDERVIFAGEVTTHQYGFPENGFYEGMEGWVAPEKLVSYGTGIVDVYVNVTSFASRLQTQPSQYILYAHNATELGVTCCDGASYLDVNDQNDLKTYHFQVEVDPQGMDSPYQPASRWGFRLAARIGAVLPELGPVGFTDGDTYDVTYHMMLIARKATGDAAPPAT